MISITYAICGLTIMGILILTVVSSIQVDRFLRDELRLRIGDAATMMAKNIDGDLHAKIQTVEDDKSPAFEKLKNNLWRMREGGTEIANAYTMRKLDNGEFVFIVDGSAKDQNAIGDIYPVPSTTLRNAFNATPETVENILNPKFIPMIGGHGYQLMLLFLRHQVNLIALWALIFQRKVFMNINSNTFILFLLRH